MELKTRQNSLPAAINLELPVLRPDESQGERVEVERRIAVEVEGVSLLSQSGGIVYSSAGSGSAADVPRLARAVGSRE
jgi:hypothetical protein